MCCSILSLKVCTGACHVMIEDTLRPCTESGADPEALLELARMRMPFGAHKGKLLIDLPEHYVVWLAGEGFPQGKLGDMLRAVYDIKVNGLEYLFKPLRK